ncbi:unnamed protein product, partial [Tenebrio molitor]
LNFRLNKFQNNLTVDVCGRVNQTFVAFLSSRVTRSNLIRIEREERARDEVVQVCKFMMWQIIFWNKYGLFKERADPGVKYSTVSQGCLSAG